MSGPRSTAPAADAQVNVVGTINLLEAARAAGARVLFASSGGALYGRAAPIPPREEVLPLPESPYGTAKYCAECYIGLYNRLHGTRHAVLRLANVYGPRQAPDGEAGVITVFCASALAGRDPVIYGDGTQTRDYVYVGDTVHAFLAAKPAPFAKAAARPRRPVPADPAAAFRARHNSTGSTCAAHGNVCAAGLVLRRFRHQSN